MSPEPTADELRARLEQSFERWRRRIDEQETKDEPAESPDADDAGEPAAA